MFKHIGAHSARANEGSVCTPLRRVHMHTYKVLCLVLFMAVLGDLGFTHILPKVT